VIIASVEEEAKLSELFAKQIMSTSPLKFAMNKEICVFVGDETKMS
jgi:hypothetical protein